MDTTLPSYTSVSDVSNNSGMPVIPITIAKNNSDSDSDTIAMKPISVRASSSHPNAGNNYNRPGRSPRAVNQQSSCCLLL